ncbi:MAG: MBL fold metallo-hydrolase [Bacteroidota bacterium]
MKKFIFLLISFSSITVFSQRDTSPDTIQTSLGKLVIQPILHGSIVLSWNNKTIYLDPYGGAERFEPFKRPDIILITDIHGDHLDLKTLDALDTRRSRLFAPQAVKDELPKVLQEQVIVIENGQTMILGDIEILAIPMYNLPETEDSRHPKGRGNGYILTLGGKRLYISGDTEDIPEMRNLTDIDIAFVCMNLPYTMSIDQAASAVKDFKPKLIYPYHYRGKGGLSDVRSFKDQIDQAQLNIEVRIKDWYSE